MSKVMAWRDVDNDRRRFGVVVRMGGLDLHLGRRLYRVGVQW